MTATQRVPPPPSRLAGHEGALALVVLIAILGAIGKPWGAGSGASAPMPSVSIVASPTEAVEPRSARLVFDPTLYGPFEPPPDWSLWPAGYFVSIQFVTRESNADRPVGPVPSVALAEPSGVDSSPSPAVVPPLAAGPDWPSALEIGPGDHLLWLGINTPLGWSVREAVLRRLGRNGASSVISTARLPSPWDDHFTVIGIPTGQEDILAVWPNGHYRLDLTVMPGEIERTIAIDVRTLDEPAL
jgi:hypothetical protein